MRDECRAASQATYTSPVAVTSTVAYPWCHEIELLLACARKDMRVEDLARAQRAIEAGVDWDKAIEYAHPHGLLPLFARHATALGAPDPARAALQARALNMARRRLRLTGELMAILKACKAAGIPAVPLKGPVLADRVYGDVALRYYKDLDILFRKADLPAASALLTARGYQVESIPDSARFSEYNAHDLAAFSPEFHVELHYSLMTPRGRAAQSFEDLEGVLEERGLLGTIVRVLPPAVDVGYLCEHGSAHAWSRIEWLATVDALDARVSEAAPARVVAARALADRLLNRVSPSIGLAPRLARANRIVIDRLTVDPRRTVPSQRESYRYQRLTDGRRASRMHLDVMTFLYPAPYDMGELPAWAAASPLRFLARPYGLLVRRLRGARHLGRQTP